ncbi:DUF58 domain-containing protein [Micrococcales bacterium 31B]|nr:DUF58 domain-containing protein [Micrococcales bacterium 31B]
MAPLGWVCLVGVAVSLTLGLWLHWFEFMLVACSLGIALLAASAYLIGRQRFDVSLDVAKNAVEAGEPAEGGIRVTNRATRASAAVRIEFRVGAERGSFTLPRLQPDETHEMGFRIPTHRRAVINLGPVTSVRDDPFALLSRTVYWTKVQELLVYPKVVRLPESETGFLRDLEGFPSLDISDSDMSFHALRDYVRGDDTRQVHWKSSARTGRLMVRQFEESRRSRVVIALDDHEAAYAKPDEFELAISCAASVALETMRSGKRFSIFNGPQAIAAPHRTAALDAYTRLDFATAHHSIHEMPRLITMQASDASAIVWVTGSSTSPADLRRSVALLPLGAMVIILRADLGAKLTRNSLGIATVTTVGDLEHLASGMRLAGMG